jgi:hypothetical protein
VLGTFRKTEAGIRELETRESGLRAELRRLLILVDGKRSTEALVTLFRGNEFSTLIFELVAHGLIEPVMAKDLRLQKASSVTDTEYALLSGPQLRSATRAAVDAVTELLGGRAKPWVKRLNGCTESRALRATIDEIQRELQGVLGPDAAQIFVETVREGARRALSVKT